MFQSRGAHRDREGEECERDGEHNGVKEPEPFRLVCDYAVSRYYAEVISLIKSSYGANMIFLISPR